MSPIPSVTAQGVKAEFIAHTPSVRNYNSGSLRVGDSLVLATRFINPNTHRSDIAINKLERHETTDMSTFTRRTWLHPERLRILDLPRFHGMEHFEDARLFVHYSDIFVAYTEGHYYCNPFKAVQKLARLDSNWNVVEHFTIEYGKNTVEMEKNWQFFSNAGRIHFVYQMEPTHVVVTLDRRMKPIAVSETPSIEWPHGTLSGGTPPIKTPKGWVSFFHSYVKEEPHKRRYSMSAYRFDPVTFAITDVTNPLIIGSEADPILPNTLYPNWLPLVIFPVGAMYERGTYFVTAGVNDSKDVLLTIPESTLKWNPPTTKSTPVALPSALNGLPLS